MDLTDGESQNWMGGDRPNPPTNEQDEQDDDQDDFADQDQEADGDE